MNKKIRIGIIGGAGYTGGELIRLLLNHPNAEIVFVHSKSNAGNPLHKVHQDLFGETDLKFDHEINEQIELLFLCLGHGESSKFLAENKIASSTRIIDLANDFRLTKDARQAERQFIYGLPEMNREKIKSAKDAKADQAAQKRNDYCKANPNDKGVPKNGISCVDYCAKPDSKCVVPKKK